MSPAEEVTAPSGRRRAVAASIDSMRLLERTYEFVSIPSPTGEEAHFAAHYAEVLGRLGLETSLDHEFASSPSVIARWHGSGGGPTLQLDGHTDAIIVPHGPPELNLDRGIVRGRGAADMKGGLAAIVEAIRALQDEAVRLRGDLLVTAHGLHEAPGGDQRTIRSLLRRGVKGDAALIPELNHDTVPIAARGMSIFTFEVRNGAPPMHEVELARREANPTFATMRLLSALQVLAARLERQEATISGKESVFVGQVHAGDFYNRVATGAQIVGTRRYCLPTTFSDIESEMEVLRAAVAEETGLDIAVHLQEVGPAYELDVAAAIVTATREALGEVTGALPSFAAAPAVGNAVDFVVEGVPAVYHGVNQATAHSDHEEVSGEDLARCARVLALTAMTFCGVEGEGERHVR